MAKERQEAEWLRTGVHAATVAQPHVKKPIDPIKVIPPVFRPRFRPGTVTKSRAVVDAESPRAWRALDRFFTQGRKPETYVIRVAGKSPRKPGRAADREKLRGNPL